MDLIKRFWKPSLMLLPCKTKRPWWGTLKKKLVKSCQVKSFWAPFCQLKPQWHVASTVKKQRAQPSQLMQPQETEITVNLMKFGWKNLWNHIRWTYFWQVLIIWTTVARCVISQETKATAFSADATTGNGNKSKSAEIWLKKLVKSHQVKLFLAGFNHLKPQWRVVSSVKKQRPQRTQARWRRPK